jgi:hypothetical protein
VVDRIGVMVAYVYFCDESERRQQTKHLSHEDGIAAAKVMARALTDAAQQGSDEGIRGGSQIS